MLAALVAFVALIGQGSGQTLQKKLVAEAQKSGWTYIAPQSVDIHAPQNTVDCRLAYGSHYVKFSVMPRKSSAGALKALKAAMATSSRRTVIEEVALKGTGLSVDVPDFSNLRLSSMKVYASGNMRITGVVKNTAVFIAVEAPPSATAAMPKPKTDEQVYDDVIAFAKLLAAELKK